MATTAVAKPIAKTAASQAGPRIQIGRVAMYGLLTIVGLVLFMPFILAFLGTFKTDSEIIAFPPTFFPPRWIVENWPKLWNTDFGGLPRPEGSTSLGVVTGLFAFFVLFMLLGLSAESPEKGLPRRIGLPVALVLAGVLGAGVSLYLNLRFQADPILLLTIAPAIAMVAMLGVAILAMSRPDWSRVILAMLAAMVAGGVVMILFDQFAVLAGGGRFFRWLFNTALLATTRAFLLVTFCAMAAFAFARLKFPGQALIFNFMLLTMMIPGAVTLIPKYALIAKLGWINTAYSLVLPSIVDAFGIFVLTQFLKAIPKDLEEAAYIDGASIFQTFKDVILPLARPALLTVFILQFQGLWNDYLTPLLYLNTPDMWVLNVALGTFQQQYKAAWNLTLVGAMINAIVPLTLFFLFSKYYIEGVAYTGVKG